jgi:hypothetical protein
LGVDAPRLSLLVFERVPVELGRVLRDARCSFVAADGQYYLAISKEPPGTSAAAAQFAAAALVYPGPESSTSTIDLASGRAPAVAAGLANPIEFLHWLVAQPAAADFHPTVNAYLGSSDPDDILPYLPFHPAPGEGGEGISLVVAVGVRHLAFDHGAELTGVFKIAGLDLQLPGEALGA